MTGKPFVIPKACLILSCTFVLWVFSACLAKGTSTGTGAVLNRVSNAPGGMAGPAGPSVSGGSPERAAGAMSGADGNIDGEGEGDGVLKKETGDPTAGADTPVTMAGNTTGFSPKNPTCRGIHEIHICIGHVRVEDNRSPNEPGRLPYHVSGSVYAKINGGDWTLLGSTPWFLIVYDLLHPDPAVGKTRLENKEDGFSFYLNAAPGRPIRLENRFCGRVAHLDFNVPENSQLPFLVDPDGDPCSVTAQQDEADPTWVAEEEALPPILPARPATPAKESDPFLVPDDEDLWLTENPKGKRLYEDRYGGRGVTPNIWE